MALPPARSAFLLILSFAQNAKGGARTRLVRDTWKAKPIALPCLMQCAREDSRSPHNHKEYLGLFRELCPDTLLCPGTLSAS